MGSCSDSFQTCTQTYPHTKGNKRYTLKKTGFCIPFPRIPQVTPHIPGGVGHTQWWGRGAAGQSWELGVHRQFAKKVNVDLQFSWKSIKQMSLKHNQIGTMVILHLSQRLGFCHFYDQFKCFSFFCDHAGICN